MHVPLFHVLALQPEHVNTSYFHNAVFSSVAAFSVHAVTLEIV